MRSEKKIALLESRAGQLQRALDEEKSKSFELQKEISDLQSENDSLRQKNELLRQNVDSIIGKFKDECVNLQSAKNECSHLSADLKSMRRHYECEMNKLIKGLK